MGDRVVDCARLESVCAFIGTAGSNPAPSATQNLYFFLLEIAFIIRALLFIYHQKKPFHDFVKDFSCA